MTDRDATIARIRKLSKMTTANGCSEQEALFAAKRVADLIAEFQVDQTELRVREDARGCIRDEFIIYNRREEWTRVVGAIATLFSTRGWREFREDDPFGMDLCPQPSIAVHFYGYPEDVAASCALIAICYTAIQSESLTWHKAQRKKTEKSRRSFETGMASRLAERIREMKPRHEAKGTDLIVLKGQLVDDEFANYCRDNNLRLVASRRSSAADPRAMAAGYSAGNKVDLGGHKVTAPRRALGG